MKLKPFVNKIVWQVILLFLAMLGATYCFTQGYFLQGAFIIPLIIYQVYFFIKQQQKAEEELNQFVQSIQYRDFSRHFDVQHAPEELKPLRKGFNEINSTLKVISKEKETQYQYLQKILELVDTGILSYDIDSGEVMWMNETLKKLLQLPYLKTVHSLKKRDEDLYNEIVSLPLGENKIATAQLEKASIKLLLAATALHSEGRKFKLVVFQNVHEALDETESRAWQKLLSVMTHEIMNSVAPISSLADTLKNRLHSSVQYFGEASPLEDIELGITTIKRRSEGLLKFAETYRNLNKITRLSLQRVYIRDLFGNLHHLMQPTFEQKKIELEIIMKDPELCLMADINLLEQVLINLLVNAIEAVKERPEPRIVLSAEQTLEKKVIIKVADNGHGMTSEVLDKIFIPFFSTKKNGSGIGLSLCKQIIFLHKGTIQVQSVADKGTAFSLQFM